MDFYALLAFAVTFITIGYLLGSYERKLDKNGVPHITTPDNPRDLINNLQGQIAAQRIVLQKWTDEAVELGFDGIHDALNSIRRHRHTKIRVIASAKGSDAQAKVVSLLRTGNAGQAMREIKP